MGLTRRFARGGDAGSEAEGQGEGAARHDSRWIAVTTANGAER
jgi:hypothetical protein